MAMTRESWQKVVLGMASAAAAIMITTIASPSSAKDLSSIYDRETLEYWKERYSPNILWNLEHVIEPVLTEAERAKLQEVALKFPLVDRTGDPFGYAARAETRSIELPILSVRFLDELAIAWAWLRVNGFTTETVPEYLTMLKYQGMNKFPGARYPTPVEGLHIPENALEDQQVDRLSQDVLKSTMIYILARELGFLYVVAPYSGAKERHVARSDQIIRADAFALEVMRRVGTPPDGLAFYLTALAYWTPNRSDFPGDEAYQNHLGTLPESALFPERLHRLADSMVWGKDDFARQQDDRLVSARLIEQAARQVLAAVAILESESVQKAVREAAAARTLDDLRPR